MSQGKNYTGIWLQKTKKCLIVIFSKNGEYSDFHDPGPGSRSSRKSWSRSRSRPTLVVVVCRRLSSVVDWKLYFFVVWYISFVGLLFHLFLSVTFWIFFPSRMGRTFYFFTDISEFLDELLLLFQRQIYCYFSQTDRNSLKDLLLLFHKQIEIPRRIYCHFYPTMFPNKKTTWFRH